MKIRRMILLGILSLCVAAGSVVSDKPAEKNIPAEENKTVSTIQKPEAEPIEDQSVDEPTGEKEVVKTEKQSAEKPSFEKNTFSSQRVTPKKTDTPKKKKAAATTSEPQQEKKSAHVHNWQPVYEDKVYEDIESYVREICHGCGADITDWSREKWHKHQEEHMDRGEPSGFAEREFKKTYIQRLKPKSGINAAAEQRKINSDLKKSRLPVRNRLGRRFLD